MGCDGANKRTGVEARCSSRLVVPLLQEMEQEQLDEQLMAPAAVPSSRLPQAAGADRLPQVPSGRAKVKQQKTQEELEYDELEALQAEMAL